MCLNAIKLLANQQEDGAGLLHNIEKDSGQGEQQRREFIEVDNERALDVGSSSWGHENTSSVKAVSTRRVPRGDSQGETRCVDLER